MRTSHRFGAAVAAVAAVGITYWATAGPLTPPAGPVADTSPSLADLQSSINALSPATAGPADTSTTPGDATDGRPLMTPNGFGALTFELEIAGVGTSFWEVVEFSESVDIILQQVVDSNGQQLLVPIPGVRATPQMVLVRDISESIDPTVYNWWTMVKEGNPSATTTVSLVVRDLFQNEIARWNMYQCFPSVLDVRAIDGQMAEQLKIVGEEFERVYN